MVLGSCLSFLGGLTFGRARLRWEGTSSCKTKTRLFYDGSKCHVNIEKHNAPFLPVYTPPPSQEFEVGIGVPSTPLTGPYTERVLKENGFTVRNYFLKSSIKQQPPGNDKKKHNHFGNGVKTEKKPSKKVSFSQCLLVRYYTDEISWLHEEISHILHH